MTYKLFLLFGIYMVKYHQIYGWGILRNSQPVEWDEADTVLELIGLN